MRTSRGLTVFNVVMTAVLLVGGVLVLMKTGAHFGSLAVIGVGLFGVLGSLDALICRIELGPDALVAVTLFSRKEYLRSDIEGVTWEAGAGVALKLRAGGWAQLPNVRGTSQGVTNSIRAWLKRPSSEHGAAPEPEEPPPSAGGPR